MSEEVKINFLCPFCNKEVQEDEDVVFDEVKMQMAHTECLKKDFKQKEETVSEMVDI